MGQKESEQVQSPQNTQQRAAKKRRTRMGQKEPEQVQSPQNTQQATQSPEDIEREQRRAERDQEREARRRQRDIERGEIPAEPESPSVPSIPSNQSPEPNNPPSTPQPNTPPPVINQPIPPAAPTSSRIPSIPNTTIGQAPAETVVINPVEINAVEPSNPIQNDISKMEMLKHCQQLLVPAINTLLL
jgi:hypothetical protein